MKLYCVESPRTLVLVSSTHTLLFKAIHSDTNKPRCVVELVSNDKLDLKFSKKLCATEISGFLGLIHVDGLIFLVTITRKQEVAKPFEDQSVNKIINVEFFCLNINKWDDFLYRLTDTNAANGISGDTTDNSFMGQFDDTNNPASAHPCYDLKKLLSDGSFCYSTDFDLTNNLQTRGVIDNSLIIDTYQEDYMWNNFMMEEMIQFRNKSSAADQTILDDNGFLTTVIRGFAKTKPISVSNSRASLSLISRQSCKRAGTRFNSRGVDDDGNVANFVETEVILNIYGKIVCSYSEIRGSIPVFWEQDASQLTLGTPKVQITRSKEATNPIFAKHFDNLIDKYGAIHVVNLLSRKASERELSDRYKSHILDYQKASHHENNPLLTEFDFHLQTKGGNYAAAKNILRYLNESIEDFEYFSYDYSQKSVLTKQTGIFRTNCLDCLDRTNVIQTITSLSIFKLIFADFNLSDTSSSQDLNMTHDMLWADNGDQISQIYTGTNALKSSFSRNGGKMTLGLFLSDATKSVTRMYQNNFVDQKKQVTIDTMLGRLPGTASSPVILYDPVNERVEKSLKKFESKYASESVKSMFIGTFNLNGHNFTNQNRNDLESLISWLVPDKNYFYSEQPDIYCLGFQEVVELNATSLLNVDYSKSAIWQKTINGLLNANGDTYTLIRSEQMASLFILFFAKKSIADKITSVEGFSKKTGLGGIAGNKGAVAVRFNVGATSFCCINSHLASGSNAVAERNADYESIMNGIYFSRKGGKVSDHDNILWFGDLNYRLTNITGEEVRGQLNMNAGDSDMSQLLMRDQLLLEIQSNRAFKGFSEDEITFRPTYKYDNYTNVYDTSEKQRTPSWTDRILFRGKSLVPMRDSYDCAQEVMFSDHKPVYCLFEANVTFVDEALKRKIYDKLYEQFKKELPQDSNSGSLLDIVNEKSQRKAPSRVNTLESIESGSEISLRTPPRAGTLLDINSAPLQSRYAPPTSSKSFMNNQNSSAPQLDLLSLNDDDSKPSPPLPRRRMTNPIETNNSVSQLNNTSKKTNVATPPPPPTSRKADVKSEPVNDQANSDAINSHPPGFSSSVLLPKSKSNVQNRPPVPTPPNKPQTLESMAKQLEINKKQVSSPTPPPTGVARNLAASPPPVQPRTASSSTVTNLNQNSNGAGMSLPPGFSTTLIPSKKPAVSTPVTTSKKSPVPTPTTPTTKKPPIVPKKPQSLAGEPVKKDQSMNDWKPLVPK
ncbi:phosphatidylinositol-3-/phosphoinositide 5-phosphatase [Saccharomycopsis crataegensis]|uniref:phosphoinositide 5-phosphatase n=1 Tax=Saccharomycopsis crataegensis TaxID=43959 RepID=A0AAV5QIY1_9ASCO|nr:phosphatidylinositol-3-/phosphoinositide 5-phosphatase [Saccharomycopsis crataegensis]